MRMLKLWDFSWQSILSFSYNSPQMSSQKVSFLALKKKNYKLAIAQAVFGGFTRRDPYRFEQKAKKKEVGVRGQVKTWAEERGRPGQKFKNPD